MAEVLFAMTGTGKMADILTTAEVLAMAEVWTMVGRCAGKRPEVLASSGGFLQW